MELCYDFSIDRSVPPIDPCDYRVYKAGKTFNYNEGINRIDTSPSEFQSGNMG